MQVAIDSIIAGKYRLKRPLARGGMGSVWVAQHVKLGSRLAVKFLDPRFAAAPAFIERFEREARAAASLESPHVVQVRDYGVEDDVPYLVMELLDGEDLGVRLSRVGRMSLPETARILKQIAKALRKAHDAGIVHRDLKPANLFVTRGDDEEIVKVLDFGIAKETASAAGEATKTGEVMGSPHYMSPEQASAEKGVDHRADIWSVGVILYRMVTGALPFPGEAIGAVLSRILVHPVPPVHSVAPDLPASLDAFFARALAKPKEQRFQSIRELVDAFVAIAGGVPLSPTGHVTLATSTPDALLLLPPASGAGDTNVATIPLPAGGVMPFRKTPQDAPPEAAASTLTTANATANVAHETPSKPRRSLAPWIALATLVLGGGGGTLGWLQLRSASPSGTVADDSASTPAAEAATSASTLSTAPSSPTPTPTPARTEEPARVPAAATGSASTSAARVAMAAPAASASAAAIPSAPVSATASASAAAPVIAGPPNTKPVGSGTLPPVAKPAPQSSATKPKDWGLED